MDTLATIGQRYGRLVVIRECERRLIPCGKKVREVECKCDCGDISCYFVTNFHKGRTKSCGCLKAELTSKRSKTHGSPPEWNAWRTMKDRCYNSNSNTFQRYGARGIVVCDSWRNSFESFSNDMGPKPSKNHSIDRIDNNGPYSPENCRWATRTEQSRNTRGNRILEFKGRSQCVAAWADELQIKSSTLYARLYEGWSVERALTTPQRCTLSA